jgi:tight adherence protein B
VLGLAPLAFTALVSTIEPGMVRFLLTTPVGLVCLAGGLGLEAAGMVWMSRIVAAAT